MKGPGAQEELARAEKALMLLGGSIKKTLPVSLPEGMGERLLLLVTKDAPTPETYPRRPGLPKKRPLV
jgi:16S rRNA (guanine527-N7)-methyltransferase